LRLTRMTLAAAVVGVVVAVDGDLCGSALWWLRPRAAVLA
jgi:hypothetical protein